MFTRGFTFILAVSWLSVANHCVVSAAFAAPAKPAHHCGGKPGGPAPAGPHDRCTKEVCCKPFAPMTSGTHDLSVAVSFDVLPGRPVLVPSPVGIAASSCRWVRLPPAAGPPGDLPTLLRSLTLAQNAPPPVRAA